MKQKIVAQEDRAKLYEGLRAELIKELNRLRPSQGQEEKKPNEQQSYRQNDFDDYGNKLIDKMLISASPNYPNRIKFYEIKRQLMFFEYFIILRDDLSKSKYDISELKAILSKLKETSPKSLINKDLLISTLTNIRSSIDKSLLNHQDDDQTESAENEAANKIYLFNEINKLIKYAEAEDFDEIKDFLRINIISKLITPEHWQVIQEIIDV